MVLARQLGRTDRGRRLRRSLPRRWQRCVPAAPLCSNGSRDASETDVDCDCVTSLCEAGTCVPNPCQNQALDDGETDIDCGGTCVIDPDDPLDPAGKCDVGQTCLVDSDCVSHTCDPDTQVCVGVCNNGVFDPDFETDVDCGGTCVVVDPDNPNDVDGQCNDMEMCEDDVDCVAGECADGQCEVCAVKDDYTSCQTCLVSSCCSAVQACLADIPKCVCWFNCIGQPGSSVQGCMTSCGNGNIGTINACINNACKTPCE